ncbi:MAG TPA: response regulator, partial [Thermoanaerobaculia bacterium]|nr:response regulator [Thermoanaerobaculia bacterium]
MVTESIGALRPSAIGTSVPSGLEGLDARPARGRVLVVDDEPRACSALQGLLRQQGYEVATAGNAFRGLELLGELRPQVVLTDLRMPGLDGLAFLDSVRAAAPGTRIIVMTGFGSVDVAVDAMRRGADDFLEKPLDGQVLRRSLHSSMERALLLKGSCAQHPRGDGAAALGVVGDHPSMRAVLNRAEQ